MADSSTFAQTRRSISCAEQRWKRGRWPLVSGSLLPAIRSLKLATRPALTGSAPIPKTTGIVVVALLDNGRHVTADANENSRFTRNKIGGERGQPVVIALRPAGLDHNALP